MNVKRRLEDLKIEEKLKGLAEEEDASGEGLLVELMGARVFGVWVVIVGVVVGVFMG